MKKLYFILFLSNTAIFFLVYLFFPAIRMYLLEEDNFIENLTAVFFLIAGLLGLFFLLSGKIKKNRKLLMLVSLLGVLAFLDELSFGERFFEIPIPVIGNKKLDGLHDLFKMTYLLVARTLKPIPRMVLIMVALAVAAILITLCFHYREKLLKVVKFILQSVPWFFIMFSVSLVFFSMVLDLHIFYFESLMFFEEVFELNAGLSLIFSPVSAYYVNKLQPVVIQQ